MKDRTEVSSVESLHGDAHPRGRGVLVDGLLREVQVGEVVLVDVTRVTQIGLPRLGLLALRPAIVRAERPIGRLRCQRGRGRHLREEPLGHRPLVRGRARAGGCDPLEVAVALDRIDGGAAAVERRIPRWPMLQMALRVDNRKEVPGARLLLPVHHSPRVEAIVEGDEDGSPLIRRKTGRRRDDLGPEEVGSVAGGRGAAPLRQCGRADTNYARSKSDPGDICRHA